MQINIVLDIEDERYGANCKAVAARVLNNLSKTITSDHPNNGEKYIVRDPMNNEKTGWYNITT
jgi:hypothetical protein